MLLLNTLLKLEQMAFHGLQIEEILAGTLLFYPFPRAASVHGVDTDLLLLPYIHGSTVPHEMETLPYKSAKYTPSPTACTGICAHTLNTGSTGLCPAGKEFESQSPIGNIYHVTDSPFILYPVSISTQKFPNVLIHLGGSHGALANT